MRQIIKKKKKKRHESCLTLRLYLYVSVSVTTRTYCFTGLKEINTHTQQTSHRARFIGLWPQNSHIHVFQDIASRQRPLFASINSFTLKKYNYTVHYTKQKPTETLRNVQTKDIQKTAGQLQFRSFVLCCEAAQCVHWFITCVQIGSCL